MAHARDALDRPLTNVLVKGRGFVKHVAHARNAILRLLLDKNADVNYKGYRKALTPLEYAAMWHPWIAAFLRKYLAILVRKHVIGPPAEHPSRRIEHQAPLIASFLV